MMTYPPTTATIIATFLSLAGASDASNAAEKDQAGIASTYSGKGGKTTSGEKTRTGRHDRRASLASVRNDRACDQQSK